MKLFGLGDGEELEPDFFPMVYETISALQARGLGPLQAKAEFPATFWSVKQARTNEMLGVKIEPRRQVDDEELKRRNKAARLLARRKSLATTGDLGIAKLGRTGLLGV